MQQCGRVESRATNYPSLPTVAMLTITKEFLFDAAHRLCLKNLSEEENREIYGKCYQLHGHTYRLQVSVSGPVRPEGMIMNFSELKKIVEDLVIKRYDHTFLNDLDEYKDLPSTAENMARQIFQTLEKALLDWNIVLQTIVLFETPTSWATVTRDA